MSERDQGHSLYGESTADSESGVAPTTWPRTARDRTQPRSRLHQALDVAGRRTEPWVGHEHSTEEPKIRDEPFPGYDTAGNGDHVQEGKSEWGAARASQQTPTDSSLIRETSRADNDANDLDAQVVLDLRRSAHDRRERPATGTTGSDYGLGRRWGSSWREAAQGWVRDDDGVPTWRPVVTTTEQLATWDVDTYLGVVTAEVAVDAGAGDPRRLGATLARAREVGIEGLVEEGIERGAHAVIGVTMQYTPIAARLLLTITGTAVTLREKPRLPATTDVTPQESP